MSTKGTGDGRGETGMHRGVAAVRKTVNPLVHRSVPIGPGGFEPPFADPKSAVLPLDEGPAQQSKPRKLVVHTHRLNVARRRRFEQLDRARGIVRGRQDELEVVDRSVIARAAIGGQREDRGSGAAH